jgi:hypothetical protein
VVSNALYVEVPEPVDVTATSYILESVDVESRVGRPLWLRVHPRALAIGSHGESGNAQFIAARG